MLSNLIRFLPSAIKDKFKRLIPFWLKKKILNPSTKSSAELLLARYQNFLKDNLQKVSDQSTLRLAAFETRSFILDVAHVFATAKYGSFSWNFPNAKSSAGILRLKPENYLQARDSLRHHGYWVAPNKIEDSYIEDFAHNAIKQLEKSSNLTLKVEDLSARNRQNFNKEMVFLGSDWVLSQALAIKLATSPDVYGIVGEYLGIPPILNLPESWFSFPVSKVGSQSAQNWHWDCDRIKWIKVFVYINDVTTTNGPHAYLAGSHRGWMVQTEDSRAKRQDLLREYNASDEVIFTASRGTVIFEDTRGFHRGTPLQCGCRLILQLEFSIDSFGQIHNKFSVPEKYYAEFSRYPRLGKNLLFV